MKLKDFDYYLPERLIAQAPAARREDARLLVVRRDGSAPEHSVFHRLAGYLPETCLLVLNNTKVIPARLQAKKIPGGGRLELLLVRPLAVSRGGAGPVWEVMGRGKVREGLEFTVGPELSGRLLRRTDNGHWEAAFACEGDWNTILEKVGQVPLPPYIKGERPDDRERYQTVYARCGGAVAAPTAGLHFSESLLAGLEKSGVEPAWVTLHVGPGTFAPVRTEDVEEHRMGAEYYTISPGTVRRVRRARREGRAVVAVGTTSARALESAADADGDLVRPEGWSEIFIYPGYRFRVVDGLLTNFHLPGSTPLLMACAFGGRERILDAYREGIEREYRFYSYGDSMLIL